MKLSGTWLKDWRSTTTTTTTARGNSFIFISKSNCKTGVIEINSPSLRQHYRLIVEFKTTLDSSFGRRLTLSLFPLPRAFDSETRTGHLCGRNRLGQIFHLTDFNNIWNAHSLLTWRLSKNRRRNACNTKPPLRSVSSLLPANHDNIIRLSQIRDNRSIPLRTYNNPRVIHWVLTDTACNVHSPQQHRDTIVREEIPLSELRIPYKTLYTTDSRIDWSLINRDTVKI